MYYSIVKYQFCHLLVILLLIEVSISSEFCEKDNVDCENSDESGNIDESLNKFGQEDPSLIEEIKKRILPVPSAGSN